MITDQKAVTSRFLQQMKFANMAAVTLSLKQNINGEHIDRIKASKNIRHFLNLLNKKIYGNAFQRYGKKIEVISVLENSYSGRLHCHLAINNPYPEEPIWFETLLHQQWKKTRWGYSENNIQHNANPGWINYITKLNPHDEVDWENYHTDR
jgi:hypothetical protein